MAWLTAWRPVRNPSGSRDGSMTKPARCIDGYAVTVWTAPGLQGGNEVLMAVGGQWQYLSSGTNGFCVPGYPRFVPKDICPWP